MYNLDLTEDQLRTLKVSDVTVEESEEAQLERLRKLPRSERRALLKGQPKEQRAELKKLLFKQHD